MSDLEPVTSENRRLHREIVRLRDRLAAYERSRWWRLHPRLLLQHARAEVARSRADDLDAVEAPLETTTHPLVDRFRTEVVEKGSFTAEWFSPNVGRWEPFVAELDDRGAEILEIGSFEGLSSCYFLWRFPDARVTCVDTFAGGPEDTVYGFGGRDLEATFDANIGLVDAARVRKLKGPSRTQVPGLVDEGVAFDLVYVDGSHLALDVLVDAALAWQLLKPQGLLIFDDYDWAMLGDDPLLRPRPAIDAFLELVRAHSRVLQRRGQVILRRT